MMRLDQDQAYQQGSFVVGGYTQPGGERKHLGALLVGVYRNYAELASPDRNGWAAKAWVNSHDRPQPERTFVL
jgi:hypothetical protein